MYLNCVEIDSELSFLIPILKIKQFFGCNSIKNNSPVRCQNSWPKDNKQSMHSRQRRCRESVTLFVSLPDSKAPAVTRLLSHFRALSPCQPPYPSCSAWDHLHTYEKIIFSAFHQCTSGSTVWAVLAKLVWRVVLYWKIWVLGTSYVLSL